MSISIVLDEINDIERYITPDTPDHIRKALLASAPRGAVKTKSMQCIISDSHGGSVSMLIDNMNGLATLIVNEEITNLTAHDAVKVANFWNKVVTSMRE